MAGKWRSFRRVLQRKRVFEPDQVEGGNLKRCLNKWDLTALGVGSTLGVGVYVLIGSVAHTIAGPSIVLSFLIAAVASLFAGLCYAEFGSRVPRAGSAYIYTYVTVGELAAFFIGWNAILESAFGTASIARGLSMHVDSMLNKSMSNWFTDVAPIHAAHMSPYFDIFSFLVVIVLGVLLAVGVRESAMVNNVFAVLNMAIIIFIIFVGAFKTDANNWSLDPSEVNHNGAGGFFPYGVWGTLRGAAVCFYGFVGFDTISSTGEEVRHPRKTIPITILIVLTIALISYVGVSIVYTMMVPYYLRDVGGFVATAFTYVGWDWARWVVSVGGIFGISASLFGAMFPLPRLLYAMASDGLFLHWFAKVTSSRKSPALATLLPAAAIAILSAILELQQLVMMMCIGTLFSYTIVAICVIILRYRPDYNADMKFGSLKQFFGFGSKIPSQTSACIVDVVLTLFICTCLVSAVLAVYMENPGIPVTVFHVIAIFLTVIIAVQPKAKQELAFKTPLVPLIPCLSIYVNIHLMILINYQTWIRIVIWILIGIPVYMICLCCYKRAKNDDIKENVTNSSHTAKNGKTPVQIIIESPTPPDTINRSSNIGGDHIYDTQTAVQNDHSKIVNNSIVKLEDDINYETIEVEDIEIQQVVIENHEEKEAKVIDMLDQVLKAEEDTYGEITSLKDGEAYHEIVSTAPEPVPCRKSLSEISDAGSDASLNNQVLSKYAVIVQVHREDWPKFDEEESKDDNCEDNVIKNDNLTEDDDNINRDVENQDEPNMSDSETNESGYNTIDKTELTASTEDLKEKGPYIPVPPPMDEKLFANPILKKSYSVYSKPKLKPVEPEDTKPRESVKSNGSADDGNIVFGSNRQMDFMSKLNNIYQNKITNSIEDLEQRKRSNSIGNVVEDSEMSMNRARPAWFKDLKEKITSREANQSLTPVYTTDEDRKSESSKIDDEKEEEEKEESLSRENLKLKLEGIFASGGSTLLKPRLMKSPPQTPEDEYYTNTSSADSTIKLPKVEKNDTLKRQKAKFSEVLSSFRLSLNKEENV